MSEEHALPYLRETILFLTLAGVLIPLLQRVRINPVLGFLAVGALIGPFGLGRVTEQYPWLHWVTFGRREDVETFAELGVIFLMFTIGLEMSVLRLWSMRRLVFGAGGLQVGLSALTIGGIAWAWEHALEPSVILGLVLAFSSTAVVMQLLGQRRELGTPMGQATFSILLFQDLAVVPLLVLVTIMGQPGDADFVTLMGIAVAKAVLTVGAIYLIGSRLVRPVFHHLASTRQPDSFMALTLLSSLGVAALTWAAGLSMAMGAMLAGLIIAETEFRHEVEITIEPFKGLLMGLFFMSVGMGIDVSELAREPLWLPLSVAGLMSIKATLLFVILRTHGLSWGRSAEGAILLSQGGEFAFIVVGVAMTLKLLSPAAGQFMLLVVGFSMLLTPLAARFGTLLGNWVDEHVGKRGEPPVEPQLETLSSHVIIAGYGRIGEMVGQVLARQQVAFVAVEHDPKLVARRRHLGAPVFYGDASRPDLLRRLHLEDARAVVLTMDQMHAAMRAVEGIRLVAPKVRIIARARDEKHAAALRRAGADAVISETLESGLQLAGLTLERIGTDEETILHVLEHERERRIDAIHHG